MQIELYCPDCCCRFAADPDTPAAEVLDRMTEEGPWYALGEGETCRRCAGMTNFAKGTGQSYKSGTRSFVQRAVTGFVVPPSGGGRPTA